MVAIKTTSTYKVGTTTPKTTTSRGYADADQMKFFNQYSANRQAGKGQSAERDAYYNDLSKKYGLQVTPLSASGAVGSTPGKTSTGATKGGAFSTKTGTGATPNGKTPVGEDFDYEAIFNDFKNQISGEYTTKLDALQRLLDEQNTKFADLEGKMKYNQMQGYYNPNSLNNNANDGIHLFNPSNNPASGGATIQPVPGNGTPIGTTQQNSMNEALYRYLTNIWQGGF